MGGCNCSHDTDCYAETFRHFFEQFGELLEACVLRDKLTHQSRGFGFITFKDPANNNKVCSCANLFVDSLSVQSYNCSYGLCDLARLIIILIVSRYLAKRWSWMVAKLKQSSQFRNTIQTNRYTELFFCS